MKNTGTIILIIILLALIGFVIYYIAKAKKEQKQQTQKASVIANQEAVLTVNEVLTGMDLSDNVRKFGQS